MRNIGLQERLAKAAAAVGRGALPVLASGLQSRIHTSTCLLQSRSHWSNGHSQKYLSRNLLPV